MNSINSSENKEKEPAFDRRDSYVLFKANAFVLAAPYSDVREVIQYTEPVVVPGVPGYISGIINYYGQICPVVSVFEGAALQKSPVSPKTCIILFESHENSSILIGIIAGCFLGSAKILPGEIHAVDGNAKGLPNACIAGEVRIRNLDALIFRPFAYLKELDFITLK